jgi:hypothetical protein
MANVQKHNISINVPSSQTFRSSKIFCKEYNTDAKIITTYLTFHSVHTDGPCVVNTNLFPKLDKYSHWLNSPLLTGPETTHTVQKKSNEVEIK